MKRILYITSGKKPYGASQSLALMAEGLNGTGRYKCEIIVTPGSDSLQSYLISKQIKHSVINFKSSVFSVYKQKTIYLHTKRFVMCLRNKVMNYMLAFASSFKYSNVSIVHPNNTVTDFGSLLAKFLKCKHMQHVREFLEEDYNVARCYKGDFIQQLCLDWKVIAISEEIKLKLIRLGVSAKKINLVHNIVSFVFFDSLSREMVN